MTVSEQQRSRLSQHQLLPKREAQRSNLGDKGDIVNFDYIIDAIRQLTQKNGLFAEVTSKQLTREVTESLLWVGSYVEELENSKNPERKPSYALQDQYKSLKSQQSINEHPIQNTLTLPQPNASQISHSLAIVKQGDNPNALMVPPTNRTLTSYQNIPETGRETIDPLLNQSLSAVNLNAPNLKQHKTAGPTEKDIVKTFSSPNPNFSRGGADLVDDPMLLMTNRMSKNTSRSSRRQKKLSSILEGQAMKGRNSIATNGGTKVGNVHTRDMQSKINSGLKVVLMGTGSPNKQLSEINSNYSDSLQAANIPQLAKQMESNVVFASSPYRVEALLKNIVVKFL
jgi:hypothetical protein